jgi:hypothetical protein
MFAYKMTPTNNMLKQIKKINLSFNNFKPLEPRLKEMMF